MEKTGPRVSKPLHANKYLNSVSAPFKRFKYISGQTVVKRRSLEVIFIFETSIFIIIKKAKKNQLKNRKCIRDYFPFLFLMELMFNFSFVNADLCRAAEIFSFQRYISCF